VTLTTRLNLFFLSALALVLAGFSCGLYVLAREHLYAQAEGRLEAAAAVLTAAVEQTPEGLEWEPSDRQMEFGAAYEKHLLIWLVTTPDGSIVAASESGGTGFGLQAAHSVQARAVTRAEIEHEGVSWVFHQIVFESRGTSYPPPIVNDKEKRYHSLRITVGYSLQGVQVTLRDLGAALLGLSACVWLVALAAGRVFCRHALRPVTRMAAAAHELDAASLDQRLPLTRNGDELEELGRAFNGLLDRVHEAFQRQQRFTGDASHQLRTPLAAILLQVEVALRRERAGDEYRQILGSVHQQANRLHRIVESLLFLARADAESQMPQQERIDLAAWLPGQLEGWTAHPRSRDIMSRTSPVCVRAHPVLLGELLNVLLDNALKYSNPGKPVTVSVTATEKSAELLVEDRGVGIAPEEITHLFDPFFRSPSARLRGVEGFGLGLSVAARIARAFGGELTVTSRLGEGSRFILKLPTAD
jgi:heavy metal sensor kinase